MADKMDDNIKKAKAYKDSLDAINKSLEQQTNKIGLLANDMGIAFNAWTSQTKKTQEDRLKEIKLINDVQKTIKGTQADLANNVKEVLNLGTALKKTKSSAEIFSDAINRANPSLIKVGLEDIYDVQKRMQELEDKKGKASKEEKAELEEITKIYKDFYKETKILNKDNEKDFEKWRDTNKEIQEIFAELGISDVEEQMKLVKSLTEGELNAVNQILATDKLDSKVKEKILNITSQLSNEQSVLNDLQAESTNEMKAQRNLWSKIANVAKANSEDAFKSIYSHMKETNQSFKDAQKNFGLIFGKDGASYSDMAALTSKAAEFNMSTKDTLEMMGQLGEELKTTDTNYLASATEHFVAIQKATGISSEEVTTIAGEMMRAGSSAEDVENAMEGANKTAKIYGVNTKKVLQGVAKNLDKMRTMGFQGGVESLTKMVAEAERLRLNVDEIFDMGKRARSIEGAMDMAADLQLAGGSFAAINPMDLLSAARKGPEELQNILKTMGDDIGKFDEKTGEFTFDAVDVDRLQIMADATGVSLDSMQKMIQKNAEDNKKMDFMPDMQLGEVLGPDGKPLDQDMMNNMLLDAVDVNGKALEGGLLDEAGVDSLEDLTADQATQLIQQKLNDQATLEEQAKQNQSFDDSITAFKDAIMNMFTVFQPFIEFATGLIQGLIEMGPVGKFLGAALIGFIAIAPMLGKSLEGFKSIIGGAKGLFAGAKNMLGMGKKGADLATDKAGIPGADSKDPTEKGGGKSGLQSLAEGLKAMGDPKILMGIGNTALAGPALALLLLGMPTLLLMAGVGAMGKLVVAGFKATADGLDAMGQAKGIIRGAIAMVIVGASLIPFAFALQMMAGVSWGTVLIALTMMAAGVLVLMGIGAIVTGPGGLMLLMGALALVAVGVALMAFGASLMIFAMAAQMMQGLEFGWLGDLGWNLLLAAPGLLLGGIALGIATPFLLFGAVGLMAIAAAAMVASQVDWSAFALMGDALLGIVPGLLGFGFAGLMFLNPILLLGMLLMIGNLGMLAMVMVPLAESLTTGADGLDRFADGLTKLQAAANSLDLEKLEMLKDLSWSMAMAGMMGGGMGDQIQKIAEALAALTKTSAGGGGGGTKKIEINLKMNGRDIQNIIVDDTSIVS